MFMVGKVVELKGGFFPLAKGDSLQSNKMAMSFEEGFLTTKKPVLDFNAISFSTVPFHQLSAMILWS